MSKRTDILSNSTNNIKLSPKQRDVLVRIAKASILYPSVQEFIDAFDLDITRQRIHKLAGGKNEE